MLDLLNTTDSPIRSLSGERRRPVARRSVSPRRRTPSPVPRTRRRTPPPRRSPPRPARRRSASPSRRPLVRRSPPRRQARPLKSDLESRSSKPPLRGRTPSGTRDGRADHDSRKEPLLKAKSDEELDKNKVGSAESSDPKLEARRRKFEMSAPVSGTQKKIFLKTAAEEIRSKGSENEQASSSKKNEDFHKDTSVDEGIRESSPKLVTRSQPSSPRAGRVQDRIGRATQVDDRSQPSRVSTNTVRDSQPKSLLKLIEEEDEREGRKLKPAAIRYTVADAKEEIELMKLKRKRRTEQILEEEGENRELVAIKKKKKKKDKEKKKEKKKELAEAGESGEVKAKATSRVGAGGTTRAEGTDLRAELSRRRAQRLQGQPGSRLIQSALEGVVADKKIKPMRLNSPPDETNAVEDANKAKGRRVHVVAAAPKKKFVGESSGSDSDEVDEGESEQKTKRVARSGILRGTNLHRRSQVIKK